MQCHAPPCAALAACCTRLLPLALLCIDRPNNAEQASTERAQNRRLGLCLFQVPSNCVGYVMGARRETLGKIEEASHSPYSVPEYPSGYPTEYTQQGTQQGSNPRAHSGHCATFLKAEQWA